MSHRARELGPIARRASQGDSRLLLYKLLHSSLYRINRLLSYKVIAAADRFNPCTYCRANTFFRFDVVVDFNSSWDNMLLHDFLPKRYCHYLVER